MSLLITAVGLLACTSGPDDTATGTETGIPVPDKVELENLLLISIDTLRRDAIGHWGERSETDFLDGLLDQSYVLQEHRSCSNYTQSAMACALTGQSTVDLQMEPQSGDGQVPNLDQDLKTVAVDLQLKGFETAVVTTNLFLGQDYPLSNGYLSIEEEEGSPADWVVETGLARLDEIQGNSGEPYFLHIHFMDPHDPYLPPEGYQDGYSDLPDVPYDLDTEDGQHQAFDELEAGTAEQQDLLIRHLKERYWGAIRYMDDQLELLWDGLEERGVLEDTLVILMTDHGEQFLEHGYMAHNKTVHYGEVDAAAAFWYPGIEGEGWTGRTVHQDLMPTAFSLMGLTPDEPMTGKVAGMREEDWARHSFRYTQRLGAMATMDTGHKRLYYHFDGDKTLYDLASNPRESGNTYDPEDPDLEALWDHMNALIDEVQEYAPHLEATDPG